jgi:predicted aspartyl protease
MRMPDFLLGLQGEVARMRSTGFRVVCAVSIILSLPAHAGERPDGPAACGPERLAELPITMKSGHLTIPARVNGKDVSLGIDTGGPYSSLTPAAARRIGNVGHRDDLRIGDLQRDRVYMGWMESFPGVDGLIAPDVLVNYDLEIDFGGGMVRLFRPHPCAGRAVTWTGSYAVMPFTLTDDGHVRVSVMLDGQILNAILDTGSPISVLSMQDAGRMFGLGPDSANLAKVRTVSGLWSNRSLAPYTSGIWNRPSRAVSAYSYPFKTFIMGGMTLADPPIELTEGRNFLGHDFATLLLGNDVLSRFHFTIAYRERNIYITDTGVH